MKTETFADHLTLKKFEAGLSEIKAMQARPGHGEWGHKTTGAHVLNLLHKIGVRVHVTTDPECDCVGGDTYYILPEELQAAAVEAGLGKSLFVKKESKLVTTEAKQFHARETLELSDATEQELYRAEERQISKILYS